MGKSSKTSLAKSRVMRYSGLHGPAKAWLIAKLQRETPQIVVLCKDRKSSEDLFDDLSFFIPREMLCNLSAWDTLPFEHVSPQTHLTAQRLHALRRLSSADPFVCVASADALMQKSIPRATLEKTCFTLSVNTSETHNHASITQGLIDCGYQKVSLVEEVGEMAVHGAVIDFFPTHQSSPVRLEFSAGGLSSIRLFDPDNQRSLSDLAQIEILPVRELTVQRPVRLEQLPEFLEKLKTRAQELETPPREVSALISALGTDADFPGWEVYESIVAPRSDSLFEYLHPSAFLVVNDQIGFEQALDSFWDLVIEREERASTDHLLIPKKESLFLSPDELKAILNSRPHTIVDHLEVLDSEEDAAPKAARPHSENLRSTSNVELVTKLKTKVGSGDAFAPLADAINAWRRQGYDVCLVVGSAARAERVHRILLDLNFDARALAMNGMQWILSPRRYPMVILQGQLSSGVQIPDEKLVFIAESEIFAERSYRKSGKAKTSLKKLMSTLSQLAEKDFVVHADYGVGIYRGLKHIDVQGDESDFLQIDYADSTLYLPVQNIGKVQKYVAAEGQAPSLDKLGSNRWVKTKERVRKEVIPLAGDLIKLYAARSVAKGWRYEPKGAEDERFADNFAFQETPDQLKAIDEALNDMASERPMDRLVCGDVGFGKTEVALRAAYKCCQHSRQVALLVPTTILVEQHKNTFTHRFNGYPIKVGAVSRFYDKNANQKTLDQLASGEIDVIIGTHRLLSKDVVFNDLGLLIIDEEHRFGVKQKELIKSFKKQVDVLTLTATPIPRTLHMSLLGIRDISVISTPPHDRRTIRTYTASYEDTLVRDAILRELQRNGQCFYLHNRIESIELITHKLRQLVPEARFEFAHGQMSETQLEKIMRRFFNRETDVLISTTIIESGLDIPNANTMIVERADTFGLAQLYQIRGRVGRSSKQAYCYFLVPKSQKLGTEAQQRLRALQSLDDLGLGFNLALRDMEIRGAGNLLGKEQSGNVMALGFDLYCSILKEAVLHLKGEEVLLEETIDPEVKISTKAFIPDSYIPDISERLVLYQRLSSVISPQEMDDLVLEIEDRYGSYGEEVKNLIDLMRFRSLLRGFGVVRAEISDTKVLFSFSPKAPVDAAKIIALMGAEPEKYRFGKNHTLTVTEDMSKYRELPEVFEYAGSILDLVKKADAA